MSIHDRLQAALDGLCVPLERPPVYTYPDTYMVWYRTRTDFDVHAGNAPHRMVHRVQLSLFSREPLDDLLPRVIARIRAAGIPIDHIADEMYEDDTGYRHIPIILMMGATMND